VERGNRIHQRAVQKILARQGESLTYVRDQMGHRSIQVTVDIYGHAVPGGNRATVDRFDDASLKAPNGTPAAPTGADEEHTNALSALNAVVSRVGIEPTTHRLRERVAAVRPFPLDAFASAAQIGAALGIITESLDIWSS
jgi:hypothetical protein